MNRTALASQQKSSKASELLFSKLGASVFMFSKQFIPPNYDFFSFRQSCIYIAVDFGANDWNSFRTIIQDSEWLDGKHFSLFTRKLRVVTIQWAKFKSE